MKAYKQTKNLRSASPQVPHQKVNAPIMGQILVTPYGKASSWKNFHSAIQDNFYHEPHDPLSKY